MNTRPNLRGAALDKALGLLLALAAGLAIAALALPIAAAAFGLAAIWRRRHWSLTPLAAGSAAAVWLVGATEAYRSYGAAYRAVWDATHTGAGLGDVALTTWGRWLVQTAPTALAVGSVLAIALVARRRGGWASPTVCDPDDTEIRGLARIRAWWWRRRLAESAWAGPPQAIRWWIKARLAAAAACLAARARGPLARGLARLQRRWTPPPAEPALGVGTDGRPVRVPLGVIRQTVACFGAIGTGKSTGLERIAAAVIQAGGPFGGRDQKGDHDLADRVARRAVAAGREFVGWSLASDRCLYDPLAWGSFVQRAGRLVSIQQWADNHWRDAARAWLTLVLRVADARGERPTLAQVTDLMHIDRLQEAAGDAELVGQGLRREVFAEAKALTHDQRSAIQGLRSRLRVITQSTTGLGRGEATTPTVDVRAMVAPGGPVTWFSLEALRLGQIAGQVGGMILADIAQAIGERARTGAVGPDGMLWLDELDPESGGGPALRTLVSRGRSAGMGLAISTQELADLTEISPHLTAQLLGTARTVMAYRITNPDSAELLARTLGTDPSVEETTQVLDEGLLGGEAPTGLGSRREVQRFRLHPRKLLQLPDHACYVLAHHGRSSHPLYCRPVPLAVPEVELAQVEAAAAAEEEHQGAAAQAVEEPAGGGEVVELGDHQDRPRWQQKPISWLDDDADEASA